MMKRLIFVLGASAALLLTSACAAEVKAESDARDNAPEAASPAPEAAPSDNTPDEAKAPTALLGSVTVDGVLYEITEVRSCNPYNDGPVERELELQGLGKRDGARTQVDVYVQTVAGTPMHDVSWAGPEGIFGGPENPDVNVDEAAARVYGTATLRDAMTQEQTVEIAFDLEIPSETISCR